MIDWLTFWFYVGPALVGLLAIAIWALLRTKEDR